MIARKNNHENTLLKMHTSYNDTWTVDLDDPPGVISKLEMDSDMALKIGIAVLDSFYLREYDTSVYPEEEIITKVCDTDQGYYVVLRYNTNFLGGESGVVIKKEDGRIHRIWITD